MILKLTLDLPEDGTYIRITRLLGRTLLEHLRVVREDVDDIEFVVGELCANVVRHARSAAGRFQVILEFHDDRVVVTVEDRGRGFSFNEVAPVGTERADFGGEERIGGFGLGLVEALSDHLKFHRSDADGTTVSAEKLLHYGTVADAEEAARLNRTEGGEATVTGPHG